MTDPRNCIRRVVALVAFAPFVAVAPLGGPAGAARAATPVASAAPVSAASAAGVPAPGASGASAQADARLGYDAYAAATLIATPALLPRPDAQRFLDVAFGEIDARAGASLRARFAAVRALARSPGAASDPSEAARAYLADLTDFASALDPAAFRGYTLGSYTATIGANARLQRESATDATFRRSLATQDALDASVPGVSAARAKLAGDPPGAWDAIAADDDALAAAITGAPPVAIRPAPHDVWALLVRGRPVDADGPRKGTLHTAIEIVYGDGTRTTIGAYPDGRYDFSSAGGRLVCATNLEPAGGPSRAYALVAPKGTAYETLARRFLAACAAFDKHRPRFPYLPQDERRSNDNTFVAGLLKAESLDLPDGL